LQSHIGATDSATWLHFGLRGQEKGTKSIRKIIKTTLRAVGAVLLGSAARKGSKADVLGLPVRKKLAFATLLVIKSNHHRPAATLSPVSMEAPDVSLGFTSAPTTTTTTVMSSSFPPG